MWRDKHLHWCGGCQYLVLGDDYCVLCRTRDRVGGDSDPSPVDEVDFPFNKGGGKKMFDIKSGYGKESAMDKKLATPKQVAFCKALATEMGESATDSELAAFARLSISDASDKLTALVHQRRGGQLDESDSKEPE